MVQLVQFVRFVSPFTSLGKVGRLSAKNDSVEQIAWEDLGVDRGGFGYPFPLKFCIIFIEK